MPVLNDLTQYLKDNNLKITCAESCTGGLLSALLTELPGSSNWYDRGFITYSNQAKQEMLGVSATLLEQHGAVSEQVAAAMALGALQRSQADISISITGIAGPDGGTLKKPVGTVCFAVYGRMFTGMAISNYFKTPHRDRVRQLSCQFALELVLDVL